jgi:hypothetical protein
VHNMITGPGGGRPRLSVDETDGVDLPLGRHSMMRPDDALLTPIFHALARGGWRSRQHEPATTGAPTPAWQPDPVERFRRDPLGAPVPVQVSTHAARSEPSRVLRSVPAIESHARPPSSGRHRHEPAGSDLMW